MKHFNPFDFLVDMNCLLGICNMTVIIPGGFVISWPLRVPGHYNYEVEIRFPEKPYTSSYNTLVGHGNLCSDIFTIYDLCRPLV